ncbi:HEAT repeat domain-containing protein [Saliterribacillus persicus]|uniref:HEAT repeat protein n=1 Tax=Saliterribacillus persicus TaxID=930114 RepID=A0A368YBH0_9BACI|nr:HEAT repeat domain-containing protein [Saliterribacillus persicus]RCW77049.1 HEAT repeat protein [Saliterribacillus persicus]
MFVFVTYFYLLICLLILFYTIGYIFYQRYDHHREERVVKNYKHMILEQQQAIVQGTYMKRDYRKPLLKELKKTKQLIAFEKALHQLDNENVSISAYLTQIEPVIKKLVTHYQEYDLMEKAYLARFIANYAKDSWQDPLIYRTLVSYLDHASIYLRENVLMATYQQSDPKWIIKVYQYLSENELFHHPKLIQDGLLSYPYDSEALIDELWKERQTFHEPIVLGMIGFITYQSDRYKHIFYDMLKEKQINLEVKIRLMRYFEKHHHPKVESLLISMVSDSQEPIRIIAVYVLRTYPSEKAIATLKKALTDASWYVRKNASQSLLAMHVSKSELLDVLTGHDRYAKEMLRYHIEEEEEGGMLA